MKSPNQLSSYCYIYQDHDFYLEVLTEVNHSSTSSTMQNNIKKEFKKVIESIKIMSKN